MQAIQPNKTLVNFALILAALLITAGSAMAQAKLRWTGCGITRQAFMTELAAAYQQKSGTIISLSGGGATKGIRDTNSGEADMGGTCRPSQPDDFPAEEGKVVLYQVGWDALVPIVNKETPVTDLTTQQVKDILLGRITNWKEVGGNDANILVVAREGHISGVGYMSLRMIFEDMNTEYTPTALRVPDTGPLENKITVDRIAFGITGVSSAKRRVQDGKNLKILKVNGMEATMDNIASGAYPYFRPLYLAVNPDSPNHAEVMKFIDFALSPEGQKVIEEAGTVNLARGKGLKEKFKYWEHTDRIANFDSVQ
ncbi:MAG: phosphate ABC transporter substrate-binding protein [Desulfobulbus sp.]|nr:MAG: phosphate ABC transporter substrate-binding protein [Desulfobulbus sp.]